VLGLGWEGGTALTGIMMSRIDQAQAAVGECVIWCFQSMTVVVLFDNSLQVARSTLRQEIAGILGEIDQIMRLLKKAADIVVMRTIGLSTN